MKERMNHGEEVAKPIYVFDEHEVDIPKNKVADKNMYVTILDFVNFKSLKNPDVVRIINDNLLFLKRYDALEGKSFEQFVREIANHERREQFAAHSKHTAENAEVVYEDTAKKVARQLTKVTSSLLEAVNNELNKSVDHAKAIIENTRDLNARLLYMENLYGTTDHVTQEVQRQIEQTRKAIATLEQDSDNLRKQVKREIEAAQATAEAQKALIRAKLADLVSQYNTLDNEINNLKNKLK